MPGKGKLTLTGQLGDVMKESATAALSFVRGRAAQLGLDPGNFLENTDLHVHVPAGAVPEGRSVGGRHDVHGARLAASPACRSGPTSR